MDIIATVPHFPMAGETIIGDSHRYFPGGKGANQAVALARLGNTVTLFGMMGNDHWADIYENILQQEGVHWHPQRVDESTGLAFIEVDHSGQNRIVVLSGANNFMDTQYIDIVTDLIQSTPTSSIQQSQKKIVLLQLEIPRESVWHALKQLSADPDIITILDPAPAQNIPQEVYPYIDYLIPNETEASILSQMPVQTIDDIEQSARLLLSRGAKHVIIKAGEEGAFTILNGEFMQIAPNPKKELVVVDTTAAGDTFHAAFAHGIYSGMHIIQSIHFANKAAGISTTQAGAQSAMPRLTELSE